jgi:hypothetical protein
MLLSGMKSLRRGNVLGKIVKELLSLLAFTVLLFIVIWLFSGCVSRPIVVASPGEFEQLQRTYSELEQRYNQLESEYSELIKRQFETGEQQRTLIVEQSAIAERIGAGLEELGERAGSISESVGGISSDIDLAIRLIQQYLTGQSRQESENSQVERTGLDISNLGNYRISGRNFALDN